MYSFISPTGHKVRFKSIKQFALTYGFPPSHARDLACGYIKCSRGWASGHKSARKARDRFLTVMAHPVSGTKEVIGQTVTSWARKHGLAANEVYKLLSGKSICYRGWMLEGSHQLALGAMTDV